MRLGNGVGILVVINCYVHRRRAREDLIQCRNTKGVDGMKGKTDEKSTKKRVLDVHKRCRGQCNEKETEARTSAEVKCGRRA